MTKRKHQSKTQAPPKLPKKDNGASISSMKKHRDANKQNVASHEVNAAAWSTMVMEVIKQMDKIIQESISSSSLEKAEAFHKLIPLVQTIQNAHENGRKHAIAGAAMLRSQAVLCSNAELSKIRRDIANGDSPQKNQLVRCLDSQFIEAYTEIKCITKNPPAAAAATTTATTECDDELDANSVNISPPPGWPKKQYSQYEVCQIYEKIDATGDMKKKKNAKKTLVKYGKCSTASFYRIYAEFKKGNLSPKRLWHAYGRKSKLSNTHDVIKNLIEEERATYGHNVSICTVKKCVENAMKQEWLDRGGTDESFTLPCPRTLDHYCARIVSDPDINLNQNVTNKTQTRFAAEKSDRSTIAYAMAACASHYWPGKPIKGLHVFDEDKMSEGAKMARELIKEQLQTNDLQHVLPGLLTSTDATTTFATVGQINGKKQLYVTIKPPSSDTDGNAASSSHRSQCTTSRHGDRHKRGLRIELNCTFNALGQVAPLFCTVFGLSMDEMPNDEIILLSIKGQ